jgi:hypothetical protein
MDDLIPVDSPALRVKFLGGTRNAGTGFIGNATARLVHAAALASRIL